MYQNYPLPYDISYLENASEILRFCDNGDWISVEKLISRGENIYQRVTQCMNHVPLSVALLRKNEKLVNMLLDIYERDLEVLNGTDFKRALIAQPEDQTEEFFNIVETQPSADATPVLLKMNNNETPGCVYLRKKLNQKNDLSLKIAKKLEMKNGACDFILQPTTK